MLMLEIKEIGNIVIITFTVYVYVMPLDNIYKMYPKLEKKG